MVPPKSSTPGRPSPLSLTAIPTNLNDGTVRLDDSPYCMAGGARATSTPSDRSLNANASAFVRTSRVSKAIVIRNEDGTEIDLEALKKYRPQPPSLRIPPPSPVTTSRRTVSVRIESEESKRKREEQARLEQRKKDAEGRAKKEEEERKRREEEKAKRKQEEAERKEERMQERIRQEGEEKERLRLEEEERKRKEEARLEEEWKKAEEKEEKERAERKAEESLSAYVLARKIARLQDVGYPEGVKGPREDLNKGAEDGKFRYDREFLMQFMQLCKEKPPQFPPLDILGSLGIASGFGNKLGAVPSSSVMGQFSTQTGKLTNEERYLLSTGARSASLGGVPAALQFDPPVMAQTAPQSGLSVPESLSAYVTARNIERLQDIEYPAGIKGPREDLNKDATDGKFRYDREFLMQFMQLCETRPPKLLSLDALGIQPRTPTQSPSGVGIDGGSGTKPGAVLSPFATNLLSTPTSKRVRTKRGEKRNSANNVTHLLEMSGPRDWGTVPALGAPLESSKNCCTVSSAELVDRKVRALLNKLTVEKFDSISDQIIDWADRGENGKDGRIVTQVVRLVFEKVTHEAARGEMYARLCRKMMERLSPEVQDDGVRNTEGKPIPSGQLFRKCLLDRCQEDFERVWVAKETTAAATKGKVSDAEAVKASDERKREEDKLCSDEHYAAQKAKRQVLGLIGFIGELFKLQMLTERIMHECVKKLLGNVENPEEEGIESLCLLLKSVGQLLDVQKARAHMDIYFTRMKELRRSLNVSPRMQFMLQDVIELRDRKWVARGAVIAPTTISAIHEAAAKEKAAAEAQGYRQLPMPRGGPRHDFPFRSPHGSDGWTTPGDSVTRPRPKAGDLSQFGKISKAAPMVLGPTNVFTKDTKNELR